MPDPTPVVRPDPVEVTPGVMEAIKLQWRVLRGHDADEERFIEAAISVALAAAPAPPGGEEREAMIDRAAREALRISRLSPAGAEAEREGLEDHAHWLARLIIDAVLAAPASSEGERRETLDQAVRDASLYGNGFLKREQDGTITRVDPRTVLIAPSVKLYIPKFNEGRATGYCVQCGKRLREHRGGRLRCPDREASGWRGRCPKELEPEGIRCDGEVGHKGSHEAKNVQGITTMWDGFDDDFA